MNNKKRADPSRKKTLCWLLLALLAILAVVFLFAGKQQGGEKVQGSLIVEVVDGRTEEPLSGCSVFVLENRAYYATGADGRTQEIMVSAPRTEDYDGLLAQPWGEATLIVYREGYIPYALFGAQVTANECREGPRIYLFEDDGSTQGRACSVIEGPQRDWVDQLVRLCEPAGASPSPSSSPTASGAN